MTNTNLTHKSWKLYFCWRAIEGQSWAHIKSFPFCRNSIAIYSCMLRFSGKIIFMLKKEFLYIFLLRRTLTNHRWPFGTAKFNSNACPLTDSFWSIISLKPSERTFVSVVKKLRSFTIDTFRRWVSVLFLFSHPTRFENDLPVTNFGAIFSDRRFGFSYPGSRG